MHTRSTNPIATIGLDIGKNTFHLVGLDKRGAIAMRFKVSRSQLRRFYPIDSLGRGNRGARRLNSCPG
jgi:hypothetical protein